MFHGDLRDDVRREGFRKLDRVAKHYFRGVPWVSGPELLNPRDRYKYLVASYIVQQYYICTTYQMQWRTA